ncbi:MAG: hypothetical protein K2H85_00685, partial [Allobaculum sp.]|nr:hypothetical protein [Allobaculum sp.]
KIHFLFSPQSIPFLGIYVFSVGQSYFMHFSFIVDNGKFFVKENGKETKFLVNRVSLSFDQFSFFFD